MAWPRTRAEESSGLFAGSSTHASCNLQPRAWFGSRNDGLNDEAQLFRKPLQRLCNCSAVEGVNVLFGDGDVKPEHLQ